MTRILESCHQAGLAANHPQPRRAYRGRTPRPSDPRRCRRGPPRPHPHLPERVRHPRPARRHGRRSHRRGRLHRLRDLPPGRPLPAPRHRRVRFRRNALFHLQQEMRRRLPRPSFLPRNRTIRDSARLAEVFDCYGPSILYHAAAYKHVPMMESSLLEAAHNNILAPPPSPPLPRSTASDDFVMISSDKAVRPTNIMGLTKRVAEHLVGSLQNGGTRLFPSASATSSAPTAASSPSSRSRSPPAAPSPSPTRDAPLLHDHPRGRPARPTGLHHGQGGEIFVLDMGQPSKSSIWPATSSSSPASAPARTSRSSSPASARRKLYEELSTYEENTLPTFHEKIKIFAGPVLPPRKWTAAWPPSAPSAHPRLPRPPPRAQGSRPRIQPSKQLLEKLLAPPSPPSPRRLRLVLVHSTPPAPGPPPLLPPGPATTPAATALQSHPARRPRTPVTNERDKFALLSH